MRMKTHFSVEELAAIDATLRDLLNNRISRGIERLRDLKDTIYAAIPQKKRIGRGITWVVERLADLLAEVCRGDDQLYMVGKILREHLADDDLLQGVPIFIMAAYGVQYPIRIFDFFEQAALAEHWVVREFAACSFRKVIAPNQKIVLPWLKGMAQSQHANGRRFASETMRPVAHNKWMNKQPEYSLGVLQLLFRESHPYPRTSVGNNLSDLSRQQPELIYSLVKTLVEMRNEHSYWIAHRACRNLVKKDSRLVMDLLGVDEYHYKDRNFTRDRG